MWCSTPTGGSQFTSRATAQLCWAYGIRQSVGRTGVCWDNAAAESFLGTLKKELVNRADYRSRHQAETKNQREITRCLKRHIAHEIYRLLTNPPQHRTEPTYATTEPKPESLSPTPPTTSTHNPPSYPDSNEAPTTTTNSPPDTSNGPTPDNRFARNRTTIIRGRAG